MQKVLLKCAFLSLIIGLGGCASFKFPWAYTISIRQGNIIDREMLDQLEVGMTRKQVRYILGTPLLEDTFNPDRWDYYFSVRKDEKNLYDLRLSVFFEEEALARWDSNNETFRSKTEAINDGERELDVDDAKKEQREQQEDLQQESDDENKDEATEEATAET